jgi:Tfp pilus assembly protein PilF
LAQQLQIRKKKAGRQTARRLFILVLLGLIGCALYVAGINLRAGYHLRQARRDIEHRQLKDAWNHLAVCLKLWPTDNETCLLAAQTARRLRNYAEAERLLNTYGKIGGLKEAIVLEKTLGRIQRGDIADDAERRLRSLAEANTPEASQILEALAQGSLVLYRWPQASHYLRLLLQREPDHVEALMWRGWMHAKFNHVNEAIDYYQRAAELEPDNDDARSSLGEVLLSGSRPQEAAEQFERVRQRKPEDATVLLGLARCRRELDERDEARQLLNRVLALDPKNARALTELGKLAMAEGADPDAEKWFRQSLAVAPFERETLYHLYLCLSRLPGKEAEAQQCFTRLKQVEADDEKYQKLVEEIGTHATDQNSYCDVAEILLRLGKGQQAVEWLNGVLLRDGNNTRAHELLAAYYESIGDSIHRDQHLRHK